MGGNAEDVEALETEWDPSEHFPFRHIERCSKLWVAAVNGMCVAGGMDLILHCDVVIASDQARFRVPELLRGIPDPHMSARLTQVVGLQRARYLFFTADLIDAHEAAAMGLVGKVVPHDQLGAEAERVLAAIALDRSEGAHDGQARPQQGASAALHADVRRLVRHARDGRGHARLPREAPGGVAA